MDVNMPLNLPESIFVYELLSDLLKSGYDFFNIFRIIAMNIAFAILRDQEDNLKIFKENMRLETEFKTNEMEEIENNDLNMCLIGALICYIVANFLRRRLIFACYQELRIAQMEEGDVIIRLALNREVIRLRIIEWATMIQQQITMALQCLRMFRW
ncbi:hypothetical protein KR222_009535 [Zaprionus bogoriensis]|nr:hypothetical protein KR222_009535 [Zaprionus bogoriensis]